MFGYLLILINYPIEKKNRNVKKNNLITKVNWIKSFCKSKTIKSKMIYEYLHDLIYPSNALIIIMVWICSNHRHIIE